jgi:hypothetical protein
VLNWLTKGAHKLNWKENSKLLRETMSKSHLIRDAAVDPITGARINNTGFLRAERNLLEGRGWTYNPQTRHYHPPSIK